MSIAQSDLNNSGYSATYCPEDNKLRLYCGRVHRETFEALRAAGYKSTPKQDCDFVATWSVRAEDIALEMIDESDDIGDEDYSPEDRATDRAERFANYRDKRRSEAHGHADNYENGPSSFGYQSQARSARAANRHERHRGHALRQWSKAEYWQTRTAGVIRNALHKSDAGTRRKRILRLETEQRKHLASMEDARKYYSDWRTVLTLPGADEVVAVSDSNGYLAKDQVTLAGWAAYKLANAGELRVSIPHPDEATREAIASKTHYRQSAYDLLVSDTFFSVPTRRLSPAELAKLIIGDRENDDIDPDSGSARWARHYELRLAYENAMLENEGGKASEVEIIPGGFVEGYQVLKVHRSTVTKRVVSVTVQAVGRDGKPRQARYNIERLGADSYRAPTAEELHAFQSAQKAAKAAKPKELKPSLLNPTLEDAQRLQDIWNEAAKQRQTVGSIVSSNYKPSEVTQLTQAVYSANSKGDYGKCKTVGVTEDGVEYRGGHVDRPNGREMFKVRCKHVYGGSFYNADSVIVITDKPQKSLPWEAMQDVIDSRPKPENVIPRLGELYAAMSSARLFSHLSEEMQALFSEARACGFAQCSAETQFGLTDKGYKQYHATQSAQTV